MWDVWIDLSRRIAEFNICLASAHAVAAVVTVPDRVYSLGGKD